MADAPLNQLSYLGIDKPTLGYRTNTSPVDESPHWVSGSSNAMATIVGEMEKRPGFALAVEAAKSTIPGIVVRLFTWRRFSGSFFVMASVTTTNPIAPSQVWKYEVGVDASFSMVYADTSSTTAFPFDFVTSNNFCFFGNQTTRANMRKFDGTTVSLWGLDAPVAAPSVTLISGALPMGLAFSGGTLSGVPSLAGNYSVTFTATDPSGASVSQALSFSIGSTVLDWKFPSGPLPFGQAGIGYSTSNLQAWGGITPYIYTLASGTIPPGLALDAATGILSGIPTTVGNYAFAIKVTDHAANTITQEFSLFIGNSVIFIVPPTTTATIGTAYAGVVLVSGGTGPYGFGIAAGSLPPGLALDSVGNVTGTPAISGVYPVTVQVTDSTGVSNQSTITYTISSVALNIAEQPPPNGKVSNSFTFTPFVSGGYDAAVTTAIASYSYSSFVADVTTISPIGVVAGSPIIIALGGSGSPSPQIVTTVSTSTNFICPTLTGGSASGTGGYVIFSPPATSYVVTAAAGAITAQTGYIYGQTFTSVYGHESSMSALSTSTGIFTNLDPRPTVLSSTDPQVTGINLYRTTDGGDADPAAMRLLASLPNVDSSFTDSTLDIDLGLQTGPALYVNNPPQPLNGFVWSNGRIWGITGAYTWFTGNEEVTNGIPAECMSNAANGNFYAWPSQVGGMAVTSNGVDIGVDEQFWQISGDTLSTFRKSKLLQGGGTRFPINIISVGDNVLWIDTAKQGWSSSDGEFGEPIRPDLAGLTLSQAFIGFHKSKLFNWIYILDAVNSILYVYNLDLSQWNVPWQFTARMTAITSGELTEGNIELIAAFDTGHMMYLNPDDFVDDGMQYGETLKSNLLAIVPGRGSTARNAAEVRRVMQFDMEVSTVQQDQEFIPRSPEYFGCIVDDDPGQSTQDMFFDLSANICDPQYQDQTVQKRYIIPKRWMVDQAVPMGRRIAWQAQWNDSPDGWTMMSFDLAWRT
jgi:hypothetical protein